MSEPYQVASIRPTGLPPRAGVHEVHRLLRDWNVRIEGDSSFVLHEYGSEEPEVEPVTDVDGTLDQVSDWPTLGTIDYAGPEGIVSVSYLGEAGAGLQCVLISAQERSVERTNSIDRYQELGTALHDALRARRTVMRWGLEMHGFQWEQEVERLRRGVVEGSYPLLDLRRGGSIRV